MPRNPSTGIYTLPPIYLAIPGTTIIAAQHNTPFQDLQTDANAPRPVVAGGTGANNVTLAQDNLNVWDRSVVPAFPTPTATVDNTVPRFDGVAGVLQTSRLAVGDDGSISTFSTDAGATGGPDIDPFRDSASPAAADILARHLFNGRNSTNAKYLYALMQAIITNPTAGAEASQVDFWTAIAGAFASRMKLGAGLFMTGATGADKGANTANFVGYYDDGARLSGWKQIADVTLSGASQTITGIPADAIEVEIQMVQVGASAGTNASPMLIRLGSGAGIVATGYTSGAGYGNNSAVSPTATGLIFHQSTPVNQTVITNVRLRRVPGSNFWNMSETGIFYDTGAAEVAITAGGFIDMAAVVVDRFQIATVANNNTLAGRVIVSWRT